MNAKLLSQIHNNLTPLDTEDMYRSMLEECYGDIEVAGLTFSAARIVEELDPTAFRCGMVDYIDSLSLIEIHGDYYEQDAVETERDSLVDDLESELSDLEDELIENEKDIKNEVISEEAGNTESEELQARIDALTTEIQEIKEYCF
jgi:predicted ribosome quality control (RQC) complex YloA/Tae2 family protein